jgi:hypothetical protein
MKELLEQAAAGLSGVNERVVRSEDGRAIGLAEAMLRTAAVIWPASSEVSQDALNEAYRTGVSDGVELAREADPAGYRDGWTAGALAARQLLREDEWSTAADAAPSDVQPPPDGAVWVDGLGKIWLYVAANSDWIELPRPASPSARFDLERMEWVDDEPDEAVEQIEVTDSVESTEQLQAVQPADRDPLREYRTTDLRQPPERLDYSSHSPSERDQDS